MKMSFLILIWLLGIYVLLITIYAVYRGIAVLRKTPEERANIEREQIKRIDEAMSKIKDDPNEPARWVP